MNDFSMIYKLCLIAFSCFVQAFCDSCPQLPCWFVQEKTGRGGGFSAEMTQEKALLHIMTDGQSQWTKSQQQDSSDVSSERVYYINDPAGMLCHRSLHPRGGSVQKLLCEMNTILPHPTTIRWAAALTDSALSPIYLQADWFSVALQGLNRQLVLSSVMRAPTAHKEPIVVLSVSSKTVSVEARLGAPTLLDCEFWINPSSPLSGSGFAVEWRYQFRGQGQTIMAYDGKNDRLAEGLEEGATLDFEGLHEKGNASLILQKTKVRHSGTYICMVYLPYLLTQVSVDLEIVEPPSLSLQPSALPLTLPGQVVIVHCEASGFAPHSLDLSWEFIGADGKSIPLGSSGVTGHRQTRDGTYSQSTRLELETTKVDLGRGGEVICVAAHRGGTRRASVTLNLIRFSSPSIEDSMGMVGVALVLYGLIKFAYWTCTGSGSNEAYNKEKKEN